MRGEREREPTQRCNISTHKTMCLLGNTISVLIRNIQFHVSCVNAKYLKSSGLIGNTDRDLTIETSESSQRRIHRIRSVRRTDDNNRSALLQSVHQCKKLRHNTSLDLTIRLVSLWCDRIDFVDKNDCGCVLLRFLESLA